MAFIPCKGTLFQIDIATVMTTVAQCFELTPPAIEGGVFENLTFDQGDAGVPRHADGFVDASAVEGTIFWDPELAVHNTLNTIIQTPPAAPGTAAQVVYPNAGASEMDFNVVGGRLAPATALRDGLKAAFSFPVNGLVTITQ